MAVTDRSSPYWVTTMQTAISYHSSLLKRAFCSLLLLSVFLLPQVAWSQQGESQLRIVEPAGSADLNSVYRHGQKLEKSQQWGDALSYYEDALKESPQDGQLRQRHDSAKMHYDLGRRYADQSFQRALMAMNRQQAFDLYDEVLLKIDSHHVDSPQWQRLVARGSRSLSVALDKKVFRDLHLRDVPAERIEALQKELRQTMQAQVVRSRHEARQAVLAAVELTHRRVGVPSSAVVMEYLSGAVGGLDAYSAYLTGNQLRDVYAQIDGNFVGLGVELKSDTDSLLIVGVIPGSPAAKGGIVAGDRITAVGQVSCQGLSTDEAANLLQGPENSMIDVMVKSGDLPLRSVRIRREQIEVPSVDSVEIVDKARGVGYLKLVSFQRTTSRDMDKALWDLHRQGMKSLIIDLRGNPGGLLSASVDVADKFVTRGTIVSTRGRSKQEDYDYSARQVATWRMPLVLLIDGHSASASEILAAAIRDHRRGTIVGKKSYGKGSVQGIFPLGLAGAGLRLTTAKFYSPTGKPINKIGVSPDVEVRRVARPVANAADPIAPVAGNENRDEVLEAGISAAAGHVAQR